MLQQSMHRAGASGSYQIIESLGPNGSRPLLTACGYHLPDLAALPVPRSESLGCGLGRAPAFTLKPAARVELDRGRAYGAN